MIILQIEIVDIAIAKPESQSPIPADSDAPCALAVALQLMQAKPGDVHIIRSLCRIKIVENNAQPVYQSGRHGAGPSLLKQFLESFVPQSLDHSTELDCNVEDYSLSTSGWCWHAVSMAVMSDK